MFCYFISCQNNSCVRLWCSRDTGTTNKLTSDHKKSTKNTKKYFAHPNNSSKPYLKKTYKARAFWIIETNSSGLSVEIK